MFVLLCFCVATEFSANKDLYKIIQRRRLTFDFDFCMCMGHDYRSRDIEKQGHRSRLGLA